MEDWMKRWPKKTMKSMKGKELLEERMGRENIKVAEG